MYCQHQTADETVYTRCVGENIRARIGPIKIDILINNNPQQTKEETEILKKKSKRKRPSKNKTKRQQTENSLNFSYLKTNTDDRYEEETTLNKQSRKVMQNLIMTYRTE